MALLSASLDRHAMTPALFERASFVRDEIPSALADAAKDLPEVAILSTCARVEIYARVERFHEGTAAVKRFLATSRSIRAVDLDKTLRCFGERRAAEHLFAVAAGIESVVVGEPQILSQVRRCGELARTEGTAGTMVDELLRRAVEAGRRVRVETGIGRHRFSLAHAAIGWFEQERPLAACTALVVGAGAMGAIAVTELAARGADVLVCNRTRERAEALAARFGGEALSWDELGAGIRRADFVVATVSGDRPAVTAGDVAAALTGRAAGAVSIADLALPRSVEPEVGAMEGVRVVDLDGLGGILPGDLDADLLRAREIVTEEAGRYILWRRMNVPDAANAMGLEGA